MTISAVVTIKIVINNQVFEMTKDEAESLYSALAGALNKTPVTTAPSWPIPRTWPDTNPTPWMPPYTITCLNNKVGV